MLICIFITIIFFVIMDFIRTKEIVTPIKIFDFVWLIVLSLYELKLSYIQQDFSNRTLLIYFLCIISYNIASNIFIIISQKKNNIKLNSENKIKVENFDNIIKIINIIFIISFIVEILYSKGLPIVWKITGTGKTYMDFGIPSFHGMLNGLAVIMGTYLLFKKRNKSKYIYLIYGLLIISRQVLMSIVIQAIIYNITLNSIKGKKVNYKKYIAILAIFLIMFTIIGSFRSKGVMKECFMPKEQYENLPEGVMWLYSYIEFSFSNFNNLVSMTNGGVNHGTSILNEIMPTVISNMINVKPTYTPYFLVSSAFTVSTYLPLIYLDFGIIGIIIFNVIIAIFGTYLYQKIYSTKDIKWILMYAVFLHNIILLFFVNMFLYLPIIVQYVYIYLIFSNRKEVINVEENDKDVSNCNNTSL